MTLPLVIQSYFTADGEGDADGLCNVFLADAVVSDEHASHRGLAEIRAWWSAAKRKYGHVAEPLDSAEQSDGTIGVRASVSGQFPGSPVVLDYRFRLSGGKIAALEIR